MKEFRSHLIPSPNCVSHILVEIVAALFQRQHDIAPVMALVGNEVAQCGEDSFLEPTPFRVAGDDTLKILSVKTG